MDKSNPLPEKIRKELDITIVHGGDNVMRARSAAVGLVMDGVNTQALNILKNKNDVVMIFSWSHTMGKDQPSEAAKMYDVFKRRLKVLDASGKIPGWVSFTEEAGESKHFPIYIGDRKVMIYLEDESVDTEDNAEKSMKIIQEIIPEWQYNTVNIAPLSSDFHTQRIWEAFERQRLKFAPLNERESSIKHMQAYMYAEGFDEEIMAEVKKEYSLTEEEVVLIKSQKPKHPYFEIAPISAEEILENAWGNYAKYGKLKKRKISLSWDIDELMKRIRAATSGNKQHKKRIDGTKIRLQEIVLVRASRSQGWREKIRELTQKRVES